MTKYVSERISRAEDDGIQAAVRLRFDEEGNPDVSVKVAISEDRLKRTSPQSVSDESAT